MRSFDLVSFFDIVWLFIDVDVALKTIWALIDDVMSVNSVIITQKKVASGTVVAMAIMAVDCPYGYGYMNNC